MNYKKLNKHLGYQLIQGCSNNLDHKLAISRCLNECLWRNWTHLQHFKARQIYSWWVCIKYVRASFLKKVISSIYYWSFFNPIKSFNTSTNIIPFTPPFCPLWKFGIFLHSPLGILRSLRNPKGSLIKQKWFMPLMLDLLKYINIYQSMDYILNNAKYKIPHSIAVLRKHLIIMNDSCIHLIIFHDFIL